jgi:hypothetical protein
MKRTLFVLLILATAVLSAQTSRTSDDQQKLQRERLELARQYLLLAGIDAPPELDVDHVDQLRKALRAWAIEPMASTSVGTGAFVQPAQKSPAPNITAFYPNTEERFVRLLQLQTNLQEQPGSIVIDGQPSRNPDHMLSQFSLVGDLSQLFLSSSDLAVIYPAYKSLAPNSDAFSSGPCQRRDANEAEREDFVNCLRRSRPRDILGRMLSGTTMTLSYGQSPRVQQGVLVEPGTPAASALHLFSGGFNFEPKSLFPTGTDWSNAAKALGLDKASTSPEWVANLKAFRAALRERCGATSSTSEGPDLLFSDACLQDVAGLHKTREVIGALVPEVSFKVQTQFDFFKATGGQFIPAPFPQNHLWTVTFTNDLRNFIPTVGARGDAANALRTVEIVAGVQNAGSCHLPPLPPAQAGSLFSFDLDNDGQTSRQWQLENCTLQAVDPYAAKKPVCSLNGLSLSPTGILSGFPTGAVRDLTLKIKVSDFVGHSQNCETLLHVDPSLRLQAHDEILLDYLEISVSPEVLLDETWYTSFRELAMKTLVPQRERSTQTTASRALPTAVESQP